MNKVTMQDLKNFREKCKYPSKTRDILKKYSTSEMAEIVQGYLSGEISIRSIGRLFDVSPQGTYLLIHNMILKLYQNGLLYIELERSAK